MLSCLFIIIAAFWSFAVITEAYPTLLLPLYLLLGYRLLYVTICNYTDCYVNLNNTVIIKRKQLKVKTFALRN